MRYKAIHLLGSKADRQFIASNGNLKGKKVQSLISQLTSPSANSKEQYFVLTERHGDLGPGIWRRYRVKNAVSPAFALLDQKPILPIVRGKSGSRYKRIYSKRTRRSSYGSF